MGKAISEGIKKAVDTTKEEWPGLFNKIKRNPKKTVAGAAAVGVAANELLQDSPEKKVDVIAQPEPPVSVKTKEMYSASGTPKAPEQPKQPELEKLKAGSPTYAASKLIQSAPNSPEWNQALDEGYKKYGEITSIDTATDMKAMMDDLKESNMQAMAAYRNEKDEIKSKQMWDGIIKGMVLMAAGVYAMNNKGVDVSGLKLDPADFADQYRSAKDTYDMTLSGNKDAFDMGKAIAVAKGQDKSSNDANIRHSADKMIERVARAEDSAWKRANFDLQKELYNQSEKHRAYQSKADADRSKMEAEKFNLSRGDIQREKELDRQNQQKVAEIKAKASQQAVTQKEYDSKLKEFKQLENEFLTNKGLSEDDQRVMSAKLGQLNKEIKGDYGVYAPEQAGSLWWKKDAGPSKETVASRMISGGGNPDQGMVTLRHKASGKTKSLSREAAQAAINSGDFEIVGE